LVAEDRPFIRVHEGMPDHPKIEGLSDRAFRFLMETWCWCARHRNDGLIKASAWSKRGTPRLRRELIEAGLVEQHDNGVEVHDFLDWQRSAAEIAEAERWRAWEPRPVARRRRPIRRRLSTLLARAIAPGIATAIAPGMADAIATAIAKRSRTDRRDRDRARKRGGYLP
jgi:hypothetical protein